ncbi:MAG TPA: DinB family protein [Vicinamibacterales bacterium]|nr:DinB family protein [Vicinamibacterales bacterium]
MMSAEVAQLLAILDQAYNRASWHGTNLRGSIRRVRAEQAAWRPGPPRHNIWEIVVHAAYWKYAVARRFTSVRRGSFPFKGSNWFRRPVDQKHVTEPAWRADIALLDQMHESLRTTVMCLSNKDLARTPPGKKVSNFALLSGVAAHDLYHAGQIQLLKRLSSPSDKSAAR